MGPVPLIDSDKLRPLCEKMMRESQAMCYILADRNGKILSYGGMAGYFDRDLLAAALGPTFAATAQLAPILGERPRVLKYYDGDKFDVYSLGVGAHHFLSLAFDGTTGNRALGNVARFGRTIVDEMTAVIGTAAYQIQVQPVGSAPAAPTPQAAVVAPDPLTQPRGRRRVVESELLPAVAPGCNADDGPDLSTSTRAFWMRSIPLISPKRNRCSTRHGWQPSPMGWVRRTVCRVMMPRRRASSPGITTRRRSAPGALPGHAAWIPASLVHIGNRCWISSNEWQALLWL